MPDAASSSCWRWPAWRWGCSARWHWQRVFVLGSFVAALVGLALLNIVNPDAMIVRENVARYQADGKIDAYYLSELSADATPDLVAALGRLDAGTRATIEPALKEQHR